MYGEYGLRENPNHMRTRSFYACHYEYKVLMIVDYLPVACAMRRSFDDEPGFVALTPSALTRTENRAPVFCLRSLIPLNSHDIAHGMAPNSFADAIEPNIVFD